jgi:hypothetical protein
MKKLLILASAAVLCISANAAAYIWGISEADAEGPDGNALTTGAAFLYLGTVGQTDNGNGTYALDFSSATFITSVTDMDAWGNWGETSFSSTRTSDNLALADDDFTVILVNDNSVTSANIADYAGDYALYTGTSYDGADVATGANYAILLYEDDAVFAADWKTAAPAAEPVPEPTSGLLLLLGMAGLALKRKKA